MTDEITFTIGEDYRKVGFRTADDFTVKVYGLGIRDAEWLRGQLLHLIKAKENGVLP